LKAPERETVPWVRIPPSPPAEYGASVDDAGSELPATSRYDLRPQPPVASFAAAAVATLAGCGILIIYGVRSVGVTVLIVGIALLIFGIVMAGSALLFIIRFHTRIELDAESITIRRGSRERTLRWAEIKNVSQDGSRLTLHAKPPTGDAEVINPRTPADPTFVALVAALSRRLDASRGYGSSR
jgi:Bacterial PH domain